MVADVLSMMSHSSVFRPCIIIPIYNHGETIKQVIDGLTPLNLRVIVVDDGSDLSTQNALKKLVIQNEFVSVIRLDENKGKGAAIIRAISQAYIEGFSHALQIDADGQHHLPDAAKLLKKAAEFPEALITGIPIYDNNVPKVRFYARYLTHFWVWLETLSFAIKDSMIGFRVYPVDSTMNVINQYRLPYRMAFDTEIMVRLFWEGIPVYSIPTPITYPKQGKSHFKMFWDNAGLTIMHTRLVCGMLLRLPKRILGKNKSKQSTHWSSFKEQGGWLALTLTFWVYRFLGEWGLRCLLYPVITYYYLFSTDARKVSSNFLKQAFAYKPANESASLAFNGLKKSLLHFIRFGDQFIDKIAIWTGKISKDNIAMHNAESFIHALDNNKGCILISSHYGNNDICRAITQGRYARKFNVLVHSENAVKFNRFLAKLNPDTQINLIEVNTIDMTVAVNLKAKVDAGEVIIVAGDRVPVTGSDRTLICDFLGKPAAFPQGAYLLGLLLECPIFLLFCAKDYKHKKYHMIFDKIFDGEKVPRKARKETIDKLCQHYVVKLENHVLQDPLQWFNFFDFWQTNISEHESSSNNLSSVVKVKYEQAVNKSDSKG
ncbi:glycosyltransferase family 2 protein [Zooshikella harenae]|uniref:Glycosyltransferase family 2 protein n=1 Tax=Zooshikella harenae TaxID=2827238 RepID=A0ABS5ZBW8_9GAMM|nr:glycosyltransferase family 2 protein [Zooshikella harenae]MBU2711258.1 glycosyltransferase family 2 protein [Zooshikella harenae]